MVANLKKNLNFYHLNLKAKEREKEKKEKKFQRELNLVVRWFQNGKTIGRHNWFPFFKLIIIF